MRKTVSLGIAFLAYSLGTQVLAQPYVINIGHVLDTQHPLHIGGLKMAEVVNKRSNGQIKMSIFPSSQLGDARETLQNVQSGTIAGVLDSTNKLVPFAREFAALDMPYLVSPDKASALVETPFVRKEIGEKAIAAGFRVIDYWEITFRSIYSRAPIKSLKDVQSKKLYTSPSPASIAILRSFGASPTNMAFSELYSALQQGVVDGADNDILTYLTTRHFEVAKHIAMTNHAMRLNCFMMSEKVWNTLPADVQQLIKEGSLEGQAALRKYRSDREQTVVADLKAKGVTVVSPDLKPFVDAAKKTYPDFESSAGKELVSKLKTTVESLK